MLAAARTVDPEALRNATDYTEGALFYHSHQISYPWERRRTRTVQIGRHVFYR